MTMPSNTVPRIYAWSHKEIVAFDTWCRNNQIVTLPNQDGWRIVDHLFPLEALALMDAFVNGHRTKGSGCKLSIHTDANTNPAVKWTDTLTGRAMALANAGHSIDLKQR